MKHILITGGAGFIGSNFIRYLLTRYPVRIVNLDLLTYAGSRDNLQALPEKGEHIFVHGDICDRALLRSLFREYPFDTVVNFAAESDVDRSIRSASACIRTNIEGTQALLDAATAAWMRSMPHEKASDASRRFVQISTDEVYGVAEEGTRFTERSPLAPNNPYAASKAAADLLIRAYRQTYGLPAIVTRSTNNYGAYQFPEKLIPLCVAYALQDKPFPIYGDGLQIRDWIHVDDHCAALDAVLQRGTPGEIYNFGGDCECDNLSVLRQILTIMDKPQDLLQFVQDRPGHDRAYALNSLKATAQLGWRPRKAFAAGLEETVRWYVQHRDWLEAALARAE